ncbi:MAG: PucR family transcriptional regulator ligand-binding domain-containing protein [Nocardioides sp.]|nr:PucR family transcriptional regulator ligand-binding domain-containing protein [Nocardioides sp.]
MPRSPKMGPEMTTDALSLADICALPMMSGVEVLAGGSGLDRPVVRLNVMTHPGITRWTKEQEFLLTTGYPLPATEVDLTRLITELDMCGVSALAVKLDSYREEIPAVTLAAADRLGFPVLSIPPAIAFDDILSTVLALIANRQVATLTRAQDLSDALLQVSMRGSLDDILARLSTGLGQAGVLCSDASGEVLAEHLTDEDREHLKTHGALRADGRLSRLAAVTAAASHPSLVVRPLPTEDSAQGHLLAIRRSGEFDAHEVMMVEQAAMVSALNISKTVAVHDVTRRFAANALQSLLTGPTDQLDDLVTSATAFGWDLRRRSRVLTGLLPEEVDPALREGVSNEWDAMIRSTDPAAATGGIGASLAAVCDANLDSERLASAVARRIAAHCSVTISVGISDPVDQAGALHQAWPQAKTAATLAARLDDAPRVRRYEALGLLRLLDAVSDRAEVESFLQHTLGPVLDLPEHQSNEMLATLKALVQHRFNAAETARVMHFHYNTVRYRVRKLESLLGDFTHDNHIALCIGVALEALPLTGRGRRARSSGALPRAD